MIQTHQMLMEKLASYGSPKAKLTRMVARGELVRLKRGLYIDDPAMPRMALAPLVYGPSYVSFHSALAWHGLIPERVEGIYSASYGKNRDKGFFTPLGEYRYLYLPVDAYPHGLLLEEEEGYRFLVASREKALCDALYKAGPVASPQEVEHLVIANWRVEREDLHSMDLDLVRFLVPLYRRKALDLFCRWLGEEIEA